MCGLKMFYRLRFPPDGFLTLGRGKNDVDFASNLLSLEIEDHGFVLIKAEELNIMISGEDESSSVINGRLRPRKSTANTPNPPNKSTHKLENKVAQDKPKRNNTPSKASPNKQDDLIAKADSLPLAQHLCPYCDKKFTTKLATSKHARRIHLSTSKQDDFINCLFCNHSEAVSSNIMRHMVDSHPNQYFACLDCNTRFFSTSELAEHKLNVCEKQKQAYRSKLRKKTSSVSKKDQKKINAEDKNQYSGENKELTLAPEFNGLVISCELQPSHTHDLVDIEDNITTNLILPSTIGNTVLEKNALMILDDIKWNRRVPPNFSFRNADADQILSRLGVVHRSPRVGESTRREWLKMIDVSSQKFEKCFDTNFYSRVASNVQQNLSRFLDGSFNFSPDPDKVIKTRKSKSSAIINTVEGFPILLPHEQYSRNRFDGYMPRAIAPKHKWKWDSTENEKNIIFDASVIKRDNHVDNCIITLVSSLDIWTQLRMRRKFEGIFFKTNTEKVEKQNIIGRELKEILESREIPSTSSQVVEYAQTSCTTAPTVAVNKNSNFPSFLGLTARSSCNESPMQPAVLSGEWVRPRCYVCCACGDQTRDSRALTAHMAAHHSNAQVQHYEIVGESLLNADILKHLYVPPSQMSNRTRPLRGFRDCTKCKKSITMEELHQHMLDCAGDTPTVRRKCRSRPFGVRRRRPRLPDNTIRKKMRKDLRTRHNQKALLRTRPRVRTEVGDAETIRKMIADLPEKRHRQAAGNQNTQQVLRPRRKLDKQRNKLKIKPLTSKDTKTKNNINDSSIVDEDDQPLKPKSKILSEKHVPVIKRVSSRVLASKSKKISSTNREVASLNESQQGASTGDVKASQPQQISSVNSTERLNINGKDKDTSGEKKSCDGAENNRKKSLDKDNHKIDAPDLLKHSINSITASSNKSSLSQQQNLLPQQANEADTLSANRNTLFKNEVVPSLPEKPPLQSNQKRSSQKKRESLLSCIEKIKSQQKGETMYNHGDPRLYSRLDPSHDQGQDPRQDQGQDPRQVPGQDPKQDPRQTELMKLNLQNVENYNNMDNYHLPLMDPHPAVISRTRDESGAAKNVVPSRIGEPLVDAASGLYRTEKDMSYLWRSEIEGQHKPNEMLMLPPRESFYAHNKSEESELAFPKVKSSGRQKRKSTSTRLSMAHNEQPPHPLTGLFYPAQWNVHNQTYASALIQAQLQQQQTKHSQRIQYPDMLLQHHQQQNINTVAPIPQWGSRDAVQIQQINKNLIVPSMLTSSLAVNENVTPIARRASLKRVSESSDTEYRYGNTRNLDDIDTLPHYANRRRMSSDTTANMYLSPASQASKELSFNALPRSKAQIDVGYDQNPDYALTQEEYGSKMKRSHENRNAVSDSTSKGADHYRTIQNRTTVVDNQYYTSRMGEEKDQTTPNSGSNLDDSNHDDALLEKCLFFSNMNKKKLQERFMAEKNSQYTNRPPENQAAVINPSPNESTFRKSIDLYQTRDQIDDLPDSSNSVFDRQKHNHYIEVVELQDSQEATEYQTDTGSTDEPLDLSGKHVPAICSDKMQNVSIENDQIRYETLDLSKTICQQSKKSTIDFHSKHKDYEQTPEIGSIEDNASDLPYKDISASFDAYTKSQQVPFITNENNAVKKSMQSSCETNEMKSSHQSLNENSYAENLSKTISEQCSREREEVISDVIDIDKSKLDSQASKGSTPSNTNYYLSTNVIPFDRLDKNNEKFASALIQANEPDTSYCGNKDQNNICDKDMHSVEPTHVQNPACEPNDEKTSIDDSSLNDNTTTKATSVDQDPETAKKMAMFPKALVDLLGAVPKDQHNKFVDVISQFIPPNNESKPTVTVQEPQIVTQYEEATKLITPPICDTLTNTENRLTINTTALPSSSILPKKRHSPSTRVNTQDPYSNLTLSQPSPILIQQSTPTTSLIPDSILVENVIERAIDSSTITEKKISKVNEFSTCDKIIDLTDDDEFDYPKPDSNTSNSSGITIQESVNKLQHAPKNSSEKTASLRAVRIKTPLTRKSITDDKQLTKEVTNQQLELKQRDLITAHTSYPESSYKKIGDNIAVDHPEYLINQAQKRSNQSYAPIESEVSNLMSTVDCGQIEQSEMGTGTSNVSVKVEMSTQDHIMQHGPVNQTTQKNMALPYNVRNQDVKEVAQKYTENDTIYESNKSTYGAADGSSQVPFLYTPNPDSAVSNDMKTVVPDTENFTFPEIQNYTPIAAEMGKGMNTQVTPNIKSNEKNAPMMSSGLTNLQHNKLNDMASLSNKSRILENVDSEDDDISLAFISKQKHLDQKNSSGDDVSTSDMVVNDLAGLKDTVKYGKTENKFIIPIKNFDEMNSIDSQLNEAANAPIVEPGIDETIKNDDKKETHGKRYSDRFNKKEDDYKDSLQKSFVKNVEQTPVDASNEANINNDNVSLQMHTNKGAEKDSLQHLSNKKTSKSGIESNLKNVEYMSYSDVDINRSQLNSELQHDETNNLIKILNTQTEHEPQTDYAHAVSAIKQSANERNTPETVASIVLNDSDMSSELQETCERALRRSRRGKSISLNKKYSTELDTLNKVEINETITQKIPVTKKQLIFSKLLQDENTHAKYDSDINYTTTETEAMPAKRKKSGKTKSKRLKLSDVNDDSGSSVTNPLNYTPGDHNTSTEKEQSCDNSSSEALSYPLDTGSVGNKKTFEFNDNKNVVYTGKRKLKIAHHDADDFQSKRQNISRKNDITFKQQCSDLSINPKVNVISSTDVSKLSQVKLNESSIDSPVAGTSGYNDHKKQPEKTSSSFEVRTACYNRPIASKQIGSTSIPIKNPQNYDPYDIDLDIDMADTTRPTVKRKSNKSVTGTSKSSKKGLTYENLTDKTKHKTETDKPEIAPPDINMPCLSDSDSSTSDVPLQKYFEDKEKLKIKGLKSSKKNKPDKNPEPYSPLINTSENYINVSELASQNVNEDFSVSNDNHGDVRYTKDILPTISTETSNTDNTHVTDNHIEVKITSNTAPTNYTDETDNTDRNEDTIDSEINQTANQSGAYRNNKQKKNRRSERTIKSSAKSVLPPAKTTPVSIDLYFQKIQRKSNLLASKKISETFSMIDNDAYLTTRDIQRNSSDSDTETSTADEDQTSKAAMQDASNSNSYKRSFTAHTMEPQPGPSSAVDESYQANDDGEVDLITAQRMLESEEIRNLERDLYSGFKEAAQKNAGRTSGFNQLRAEETNPSPNNRQDLSQTEIEVEMETIPSPPSPERPESPEISESSDRSDSPESLQDKPLMYPEEEVNIYEDKYDIIKRRREASANAKQVQKVDIPKKSKIKRRPERKINKKSPKKTTCQVSQVPTKGALKGFDGIKISIPTQDLNMPPSVSPPRHRQRHSRSKKRKGSSGKIRANSGSSCKSDSDANSKKICTPDIYEFKDDDRPVTKSYNRLTRTIDKSRSSSSENEEKLVKANRNKNTRQNKEITLRLNDQDFETSKTRKCKRKSNAKKKNVNIETNKDTVKHAGKNVNYKEKQREKNENIVSSQAEHSVDHRQNCDGTIVEHIERLSNDDDDDDCNGNIQANVGNTNVSRIFGFVPDRNDESSYDSYTLSPTPLLSVSKDSDECTCVSEIESDDSETVKGCAHSSCRYSHLNAAKNAVMDKIFKNNAVRCDKSDDTPDEPPKPKPDLDRLFDSLLEPTTDTYETATPTKKSPVAGSELTAFFFTSQVKLPGEVLKKKSKKKKKNYEKDVYSVDDGFSSPNHQDSDKISKKNYEATIQTPPNETNLLKIDDDSTNNFGETTTVPIDNVYIMVSQKQIQTDAPVRMLETECSDKPMEVQVKSGPSNNNLNIPEDFLDNLDTVPESSDCIRLKYKRGEVKRTRGTQTKRSVPKMDMETSSPKIDTENSSCEDELKAEKLTKRDRRKKNTNKKHKSHHKHNKTSENLEINKQLSDNQATPASKRTRKTRKDVAVAVAPAVALNPAVSVSLVVDVAPAVTKLVTKSKEKQREKLSPSRKSDEGISTSHDNSADADDMTPEVDVGVAVHRVPRKCTVGKQNILAEDWSSSESELESNRVKGKKKSGRAAKSSRRSREADKADAKEEAVPRAPVPKARVEVSPAREEDGSDFEREPKDKKEQELHGWIVGRSHKKLVTMLVCSKSKSRPDDKDEKEKEEDYEEKEEKENHNKHENDKEDE